MHARAKKIADFFNNASIGRMAKGNERDFPTAPLFHYTTVEALFSIIKTETFWFTSVYHMDDDAELSFGFGISTRPLQKCATPGSWTAPSQRSSRRIDWVS
jgi:hypothetical protein